MVKMTLDDIDVVAIIVQLKNGDAHQVLASKEDKNTVLTVLASLSGGLKLSKEIEPIEFKTK